MRILGLLLVGVLTGGVLAPPAALAAPKKEDPIVKAKEHFEKSQEHYDLGEYSLAIDQLKEAYRLYPNAIFLHNIGVCYQKNKEYEKAIENFETYLEKDPKSKIRAQVEAEIRESKKALAEEEEKKRKAAEEEAERQRKLALMAQANPSASQPTKTGPEKPPIYKKPWFWGAVGGAALVGTGAAIGISIAASIPNTDLGNQDILDK